jgi:hypothetical protein|uniref:Uncharacterized protein n=1 Tax=viral metagenome TaxID=1070528 RepID=A0A6C0IHY0_9ZZZZ
MNVITFIGLSIIFFYSLTQILNFFGVSQEIYGIYLLFYIFMATSVIVLPNNYPTV